MAVSRFTLLPRDITHTFLARRGTLLAATAVVIAALSFLLGCNAPPFTLPPVSPATSTATPIPAASQTPTPPLAISTSGAALLPSPSPTTSSTPSTVPLHDNVATDASYLPSPTVLPSPAASPTPTTAPTIVLQLPDIAGVVERTRPAVVSVVSEVLLRDRFGRVIPDAQSGSGVIFDPQGYILTNNHVVETSNTITVTLDDGRQYEAEVVGTDRLTDLAVLKIGGGEFAAAPFGDPSRVRVGDWVIAIGNALALPGGPTVTVGVVSALDRTFPVSADLQLYGLIQTDASINPGNSGGPLLNLEGEIVGINTAVARGDRAGRDVEGIGFAVGAGTSVSVAQQLIENGRVQWAWLGVLLSNLDPETAAELDIPIRGGVLITRIVQDGPAWRGGVRGGDVIVAMGGVPVSTVPELIRLLRHEHRAAEVVQMRVYREERELTLEVTLGERPPQ